ncbi:uncharacterized protein TNCV_4862131 [Trichonephila clavipes]|nr:uncharacterized protein TNCV_4862131 [Trichonephila clavipes]
MTADNYPKAIEHLKERFGRDSLLVQIFVPDLLNLVMKNAVPGRSHTDLAVLYDSLESKLRALESLGSTKEKFAEFLGPVVESCLPENILCAWERSRNSEDAVSKSDRTLENLMTFLRHEEESEEIISLARSGFCNNYVKCNKTVITSDVPTAAILVYLKIGGQRRRVRVLLDSGSQTSYIREEIVRHMKVYPIRQEEVIHGLLGGKETVNLWVLF